MLGWQLQEYPAQAAGVAKRRSRTAIRAAAQGAAALPHSALSHQPVSQSVSQISQPVSQ